MMPAPPCWWPSRPVTVSDARSAASPGHSATLAGAKRRRLGGQRWMSAAPAQAARRLLPRSGSEAFQRRRRPPVSADCHSARPSPRRRAEPSWRCTWQCTRATVPTCAHSFGTAERARWQSRKRRSFSDRRVCPPFNWRAGTYQTNVLLAHFLKLLAPSLFRLDQRLDLRPCCRRVLLAP